LTRSSQPGVLVTRPAHQAGALLERLQQAGFRALGLPSIEIVPSDDPDTALSLMRRLTDYQLLIFISTNAVDYGLKCIDQAGVSIEQAVAAIGRSTAARLDQQGIHVDLQPPTGYTSEDLLALDALQAEAISGQRILIFRGQGGREQLAQSLRERGAQVDYAEVYQRRRPGKAALDVHALWQQDAIQLVTVTSNESLENLYHMLDTKDRPRLLNTPLVVPGQRCAQRAQQLGFSKQILIAANASDEAMLDCIMQWQNN
jgi:uroporphyrinogen-III synthase